MLLPQSICPDLQQGLCGLSLDADIGLQNLAWKYQEGHHNFTGIETQAEQS
jgi:hypothetical protein